MKMRRLFACLTLCASLSHAQESYDRLAATVKLWNYVKYLHPRATSPDVDWNTAFAKAAPKVLATGTDQEMSAAVDEMLAALKDGAYWGAAFKSALRGRPPDSSPRLVGQHGIR